MIPTKTKNGITFFPVPVFNSFSSLPYFHRSSLPEIPKEYENMAQSFFLEGGSVPEFHQSVDRKKAIIALQQWLESWEAPHESKIATVGYALWLWTHPTALDTEK